MDEQIKKLKRRIENLWAEANRINEKAKQERRDMTEAELNDFNLYLGDIEKAKVQLEALDRAVKNQNDLDAISRSTPPRAEPGSHPGENPEENAGDPKKWRNFGEFLRAVYMAAQPGASIDSRLLRAATGLQEAVPSDGGFLVQKDFTSELLKRTYETGLLTGRTRRIPISSGANGMKINAVDESSRVDGARWGGIVAYWAAEAETKTASKPKFRQMELNLHKLIGLCYATDEMLEDAATLQAVIEQGFRDEFAFRIDDAIIRGSGSGQPLGFMNSAAVVTVPAETSPAQAANSIVYANLYNMWSRMWARSRPNAVWLVNQDVEPQLFNLSMAVGTGGVPVFMPPGGASEAPYGTIFGRPMLPLEQASTVGDVGDIILADLSQYLMIDKGGIQSAQSIHVRFVNDETAFRFVVRLDGQPIWNAPLTPYKGANTQSPFIVLAAR